MIGCKRDSSQPSPLTEMSVQLRHKHFEILHNAGFKTDMLGIDGWGAEQVNKVKEV